MSYRVLLIDDNQLALESMEKTIPSLCGVMLVLERGIAIS